MSLVGDSGSENGGTPLPSEGVSKREMGRGCWSRLTAGAPTHSLEPAFPLRSEAKSDKASPPRQSVALGGAAWAKLGACQKCRVLGPTQPACSGICP